MKSVAIQMVSIYFQTNLVNDITTELQFKPIHWLIAMYVQSYYYKHNEIKSLIRVIEIEDERVINKEMEIE